MKNLLSRYIIMIDSLSKLSGSILSMLIFLMIFIVNYEVVARYFFNSPTSWSLEAATMTFGTYMIGGGAYAVISKAHVNMDIFYSKWSPRTMAIVDICTYPLVAFFFSVMCWKAFAYGIESFQIREHASSVWSPPLYQWKIVVAAGLILLWLQLLSDFLRNLLLIVTGEERL
ncbi:TRAP transporter small permease subunit [Desulforhopalus singaporensis]|uniref:TRAP-type mannitol/chloroaromatic compound transport system, small permease component n=1 Tax=Desulforhopalus singaporensis TaxID=91360 RepID=A0A1H0SP04_9BACT|nr:TRAP transporter small permease subunit [Desulforhopalus singaporensis]SDP43562.1 TRAP-type mannitol/chloroaromatic compound transport system, small permease component [Desulforhopalus singaporensis]